MQQPDSTKAKDKMFHCFAVSDVQLAPVSKGRFGGQCVALQVAGGNVPLIQTPRLNTPWGIAQRQFDGENKLSIEMHFRDSNIHAAFVEAVDALDDKVLEHACQHAEDWFKSPLTPEQVQTHHSPSLKDDGQEGRVLRLNINLKNVFDGDGTACLPAAKIGAGRSAIAIVQPVSVWFFNQRFGIRWKLHELCFSKKTIERPDRSQECMLRSELPEQESTCLFRDD